MLLIFGTTAAEFTFCCFSTYQQLRTAAVPHTSGYVLLLCHYCTTRCCCCCRRCCRAAIIYTRGYLPAAERRLAGLTVAPIRRIPSLPQTPSTCKPVTIKLRHPLHKTEPSIHHHNSQLLHSPGSTSRPFPLAQAARLGQPAHPSTLPASSAAGPTQPSFAFSGTRDGVGCGGAGGNGAATSMVL